MHPDEGVRKPRSSWGQPNIKSHYFWVNNSKVTVDDDLSIGAYLGFIGQQ